MTRTVLAVHLGRSSVVIHTWSSEIAILHAFFGCSLLVLLVLVMILRLAAIVRWELSERGRRGHDLGHKFDFLTTFGKGGDCPLWWEVIIGKSIFKSHLP